ncbi:class I SAM-dependent methyltransferase [Roseiconus lacunae]|uniref:Class I SAM-dependent methyltransferase n=1 Tax=Roseiconus lacunae TaxID=2605694 RepID=A0ABT7PQK7_9BACT|nr:class I SAM-dependent methyltransferase [Roseiconus lacunae]MCD0463426.1 class I SAM-dependent methyltransferase [Roseiconus lacunae]MDM4018756.1 class I SAM-dependent methyltransferase [Roseiconus lacunae]WRQ48549.1 class I SAM-dependent methyltransferase [Stieleria sp. HD01]
MNQPPPQTSQSESKLQRTLEPEAMDAAEEVREYEKMNHEAVNNAFVDDLKAGGPVGPKVMDLGCGTGEIAILLCQRLEDVQVMGVDLSVEMLEAARIEIELGGVQGRVFLEHADCKSLDHFEPGSSDTVISNTVLHHIADPEPFLRCAVHVLAPGGRLFLRDLVRPADEASVEALVALHGEGETEYAQQLLRQSLHAALTIAEIQELAQPLGIPASAINATSDRHWTIDWVKPS